MDIIYKIVKMFDKMLKFKMNIKNKIFLDCIFLKKKGIWDFVLNDWEVFIL